MSQNQGSRQKNARQKANITGGQRNGDMIRMMDLVTGVSSSDYNGKWIEFVNAKFGTNINNVSGAKYFLATQTGFENFDAMTQFDSLFYDGTSGNTNPNDSGASAISVQLVPSTNMELATKGDAAGKLTIKGKSTGTAYLMLDVGDPVVGQEYVFRYDADWSRLRNEGKDVFVGIGLRSTTDSLHWAGLEGDGVGATGVTYSRIYGSNLFSKGTAPTLVTGTAATQATREGSNWIKFIYYSGNTYSFYVGSSITSAGTRDANDISFTLYGASGASLSGYSGAVQNFGIGVYTPFSDRGNFTMNITRYVFATASTNNPVNGPEPSTSTTIMGLWQPTTTGVTFGTGGFTRNYFQSNNFYPTPGSDDGDLIVDVAGNAVWYDYDPLNSGKGAGIQCNGTQGGSFLIDTNELIPRTGDFTVEAWFDLPNELAQSAVSTGPYILSQFRNTTGERSWRIGWNTGTNLFYFIGSSDGINNNLVLTTGTDSVVGATSVSILVERDGPTFSMYLNGTRLGQVVSSGFTFADVTTVNDAVLGYRHGSVTNDYIGGVGPVRICNEALVNGVSAYTVRNIPFPTS